MQPKITVIEPDDETKKFIIDLYIRANFKPEFFKDKELFDKFPVEFNVEVVMYGILLIKHFKLPIETVWDSIRDLSFYNLVYTSVSETDYVKDLLNNAKVVHVQVNPETGDATVPIIH